MYCIAGKNQCSINALEYLLSRDDINNESIIVCVNQDDDGNRYQIININNPGSASDYNTGYREEQQLFLMIGE